MSWEARFLTMAEAFEEDESKCSLRSAAACEDGKYEFKVIFDSGEAANVIPRDWFPENQARGK